MTSSDLVVALRIQWRRYESQQTGRLPCPRCRNQVLAWVAETMHAELTRAAERARTTEPGVTT